MELLPETRMALSLRNRCQTWRGWRSIRNRWCPFYIAELLYYVGLECPFCPTQLTVACDDQRIAEQLSKESSGLTVWNPIVIVEETVS